MKLKCPCCNFEKEFESVEEAFKAGWDAPPHFSHISCDLCPAVCVLYGVPHGMAHELWEKEGRPSKFTVAKCGSDAELSDPKQAMKAEAEIEELKEALKEALYGKN